MDTNSYELHELQAFMNSGQTSLPEHMQKYLEHLDTIRSMHQKYNSKRFIINYLVASNHVTRQEALRWYSDAINFFYLNNEITKEAWRNVYAEKLEDAASVAWHLNDMETFSRNIIRAADLRQLNKEDPPTLPADFYDRRTIIYSTDISKLGIKRESRVKLAEFIDALDITELEKDDARKDAGILDVDFLEDV